jgi:hypothetical protein
MADIVNSKKAKGKRLAKQFDGLVEYLNKKYKEEILSPLTITLGDEFQGVVKSKEAGMKIIFTAEEWLMHLPDVIVLRYVLHLGEIDTAINTKIAHGMLGKGLAVARNHLNEMKKEKNRYWVQGTEKDGTLNKYWILYQSITDGWNLKDRNLAADFLELKDYKKVAKKNQKDISLMWRREQSLKIREINILKTLIQPVEN